MASNDPGTSRTMSHWQGVDVRLALLVIGVGALFIRDAAANESVESFGGDARLVSSQAKQVAEKRQIAGGQIRERLANRLIQYERQVPGSNGATLRGAFFSVLRPDGSFITKCEYYNQRYDAWLLCTGTSKRRFKGWANGVWRIEDNVICIKPAVRTWSEENCYRIHDDGGRIFVEKASGTRPTWFPGYISLKPLTKIQCVGHLHGADC